MGQHGGYDKLLLAVHRFYKKQTIKVDTTKDVSVISASLKNKESILGMKRVKVRVYGNMNANKIEQIECELWLKVAIDAKLKQIRSWNDILLKTLSVDLSASKRDFRESII